MKMENIDNKINNNEEPRKDSILDDVTSKEYEYGFVTDIETDIIEKGLNENVVRLISERKGEPEWLLEFRLQAFHTTAGKGHTHFPQSGTLLVGKNTAAAAIAGQSAFLRAQEDQVLHFHAAHCGHRASGHRIQHRRNSTHIVLAQKQRKESCKSLGIPNCFPKDSMELLHSGKKDLPKLVEDLGGTIISRCVHGIR